MGTKVEGDLKCTSFVENQAHETRRVDDAQVVVS